MITLQDEIDAGRSTVRSESYAMSIGELVNLYESGELVIRPEFQRLFRWDLSKKSRLIESIFLGIPLPSIFVLQNTEGVWEVIDGLQRISTILEFMGLLQDEETGKTYAYPKLLGTKYLPSLNGISFEESERHDYALTPGQRLAFKRSKMDVKILLPESSPSAKYELFDRLNSGGQPATAQEVRNVQVLLVDGTALAWLKEMASNEDFRELAALSDRQIEEQYDVELVCRLLTFSESSDSELSGMKSLDEFLTSKTLSLIGDPKFSQDEFADKFSEVFKVLRSTGITSFKKFNSTRNDFTGGFSVSTYEAITNSVIHNLDKIGTTKKSLNDAIISMLSQDFFTVGSKAGTTSTSRVVKIVPKARDFLRGAL